MAREHGVEVYSENELMPKYGPAQGKGDAMWRSLSVARGDIVMFADADTTDFREHFVYGTLGPLLTDPAIQFCKAAFRRPFTSGDKSVADGGGRVTELMAKPLLNLFYPQLTGFVQPLAGEFAARRELLSAVPFFTGYGVEIGMLIDVYNQIGLDAMAQVDIGTRQNRHQPLADLSRMSSVVLRTVAAREGISARYLEAEGGNLWDAHQPETYLHAVATEHGLRLDEYLNELVERPPMAQLTGDAAVPVSALPRPRAMTAVPEKERIFLFRNGTRIPGRVCLVPDRAGAVRGTRKIRPPSIAASLPGRSLKRERVRSVRGRPPGAPVRPKASSSAQRAPVATRCVRESAQVARYRLSLPSCGALRDEARGFHAAYRVSMLL